MNQDVYVFQSIVHLSVRVLVAANLDRGQGESRCQKMQLAHVAVGGGPQLRAQGLGQGAEEIDACKRVKGIRPLNQCQAEVSAIWRHNCMMQDKGMHSELSIFPMPFTVPVFIGHGICIASSFETNGCRLYPTLYF